MTVTIINPIPDPSVVKQAICKNCGVTLQYTPNDVKQKEESDYLGGKYIVKYIVCPSCNTFVHTPSGTQA